MRDVRQGYRVEPGYWFKPKRFGFGATPVTWQGWALTLGFVALLWVVSRAMPTPPTKVAVGIALTMLFVTICWIKTDGGWRWRWGSSEEEN